MDKKFKQIYYSDGGYWRGKSAIQKLVKLSGSTKEAEKWLLKQPLYQIYLPGPKYVPRPNASMSLFAKPNYIHQSDLLSLPHDKFKKKTYKYALNIVDVASRYKGSSPCIMCVQYRGGAQYHGGVQYRGGYHEYRGVIS